VQQIQFRLGFRYGSSLRLNCCHKGRKRGRKWKEKDGLGRDEETGENKWDVRGRGWLWREEECLPN